MIWKTTFTKITGPTFAKSLILAFLAIFLFSADTAYAQFIPDGNYTPSEYAGGQVRDIDLNATGTCNVKQVYTVVKSDSEGPYLLLGFYNGNAGQATFRYYIDTDPTLDLVSETFKGESYSFPGADVVLQVNASGNTASVFKYNGTSLETYTGSGIIAAVGDYNPADDKFIEIKIPLSGDGSIIDVCDLADGFNINLGSYISFAGKSITANVCNYESFDIDIAANGSIDGSTSYCSTQNSTVLTLSGNYGAVIKWQKNEGSGWTDIANTSNTYTATDVLVTTSYRAVIVNNTCPGNEVETGTATITILDSPDAPVVSDTVQTTCEIATGSITVTTVNGLQYSVGGDYQTSGSFTGLAAGTYNVIAKNADGCISPATSVVIQEQPNTPDAPVVSDTVQPTCETATGSFTVNTVNGLQYSIGGDYQESGSFTGLAAGTYNVTAKNADGCISPATSVVIQEQPNTPDAPVVSETVQPTCEIATGSFTVTTVNGLQYSIGGDYQTSGSFTGLAAGTYNVTAKNADGCISPATLVSINQQPNTPDAPVVSETVQPTCETATGSFTVTTVNGLQYSIGGDYQESGSFTGLAAGTYNVTAKNADGCISPATSVVIQEQPNTPDAPVVSETVQPTCETATGSFTVTTVNGLQYSIGGDYQESGSFTGLAAGTYNVTAKNADGCISPATSVSINQQPNTPDAPVVSDTVQPTCETATGSFTVNTVNGLQYSIGGDYQTSGSFTGLAAGTYNITAKNADGCISPATLVSINQQPNTPDAPVVSETVQPTCETATGSITVTTTQGFTYSINETDYQTSGSFTGLAAGTYNVIAKNADGCISPATSVVIQEQPNTPDAPVVSDTVQPTCETATGSFTVNTVNGLQYSIGGDYQESGSFTGLAAGTYNVTAKNADGCISPATSVVIQEQPNTPDAPVVSETVQPTCEIATGSFTVTTVNGLQYSIGGDYQTSGSFTGLAAGTYNVTAKNADGCISPATLVSINQQPNTPDAPVVSDTVQPTCETATGSFTVNTVNGLQYSIGGDYQESGSFTGLAAGTYNVTAKNADGCISPATSVVIQEQPNTPDAPVVSDTVQPTCETATGSITVTTVNDLQYSIGGDYQTSGSFTGLAAGTYNVTAKNADGCISPATSVSINQQPNTPDAPVVSDTVQPTCETATGSITVTTVNDLQYSIGGDYQTSGSFTGLAAGTYNVTAKNADGCISPAISVVIQEQPNTPDAPVVSDTVQPTCETATGSFTVTTVNGLQYSIGGDYQTSGSFTGLAAGTYNVTAKNADGCISPATLVSINQQPNTPDAPVVSETVQPTCETATGSFTVTTVNGLQYSIGGDYQTSGSFTGLAAGTYNITAKNADGCISPATLVSINQQPNTPDAPVVSETVQPTCETATGSITVTTTQGFTYSINETDYQTSGSFTGLAAGTYNVTAKNADGCISPATSVVIQEQPNTPDAPVVSDTVQPTCETATGSITVTTTQGFTYSINETDYQTSGSFTGLAAGTYNVTAKNADGCISPATSVVIQEQPFGAIANNDSASTDEDNSVDINVLSNDFNPEDGELDIVSFTQPSNGTVTQNQDNTFSYSPIENFNGTDTFEYAVTNGNCGTDTATVTVTIGAENDSPIAVDDSASTSEDTPVEIIVLNNDSDPDGDELIVTEVTEPENGSAVINNDGTVTYTPNENFNGTDSFDYTISDGNGGTDTATVTVTIGAENDAPIAVDDSASTTEDTPVEITVLNNDSDPDGDELIVTEVTEPENGSAVINNDGTVTYTPNENFNGTDSFDYTISDGNGGTDTATVTVTIGAENDAPIALDDSASTTEDTPVEITVLNNDSDPDGDELTVIEVTEPENGSAVINNDGTVTYTPNENFNGTDSFDYTISDGNGGTDTATVIVTIGAENDAPIAVDDSASTSEDTPVEITVLNNDSDPDGDELTVTISEAQEPANGTVTIDENGVVTYTPNENFNGTDSFKYTISDGNGGTDTATVTVTVGAENDAPIAVDDAVETDEDNAITVSVLDNDSDPDGDDLSVVSTTTPENGTVVINNDGTITYIPNENFNGTDSFDYTIRDEDGLTDTATVTVTVNPVNDDPIAVDDSATTDQDTAVTISVLDNDSDIDGGDLVVTETTTPEYGEVVININGTITYTPKDSFTGVDTFEYSISDGNGGTDTATVTITVNDTEGPEITCPENLDLNNYPGVCGAVVDFTIPEFTDNAEGATILQTSGPASGETFPVGTTTVSFTATDAAGNTSFCSFDVIVTDTEAPVVEEMEDITVNNDAGVCGAVVDFGMIGATDNCELESVEVTEGLTSGSEFPVGTTTVTYTVTDVSGNTTTESFTVTVNDNEAPEISCPANMTIDTETGVSYATVNFDNATATDNCEVTVQQTGGPVSGSQFEIGTTTVTFTATDAAGNTTECSFTVTVEDNEDPTIVCPETINQENDPGICGAAINFTLPEISDNSGDVSLEQTSGPASGETFPVGTTTVSFTATDAAGNTSFCSFDVIITDSEAPVVEEMENITVNNDAGVCGAVVDFGMIGATDNCELESVEVTEGLTSGSEFPVGTTTVTYTVTDVAGNTTTESFTVTVTDNEVPEINCPANMTIDTETGVSYAIVDFENATATDNCEVTVEQTGGPASGSQFEIGTTTVTFTATDAAGNTSECSFTVTVEDNEDPTIVCQDDIEISNDEDICGAVVEFNTPHGSDNSGEFTVSQTAGLASGETFPVGTTTVSFTATDASGNTSFCSFDVIVTDSEAPVVEEMEDITVNNDPGVCGAVVDFGIIGATDNCELESVEVTEGLTSGSEFPVGTTTVTYTVTDVAGNTTTESFTVTVNDNEAPEISCPANMTINTETGVSYATVNFEDATATDNCEVTVEQTAGPVSGSQFEIGTTTVTFTATDAAGNTSECSFTVTVEDNEDPTIVCQDDIEISNDEDICGAVVEFNTPQGSDNSGEFTVSQTAGLASGETFPVGTTTVTFTVTDAAGNTSECSFDITVTDDQAPELEALENITVNNDAGICGAVVTYEAPTATDNCELAEVTLTEGMESGSEFPIGTTTVTYTATDNNGNTSTSTFTVAVIDNEAPVIECPENITVTVGFGIESSIVEYSMAQTTDNCSGETITMTSGIASGEEFPLGVTTITFEATDASGNTSECSFTVTVEEEPAPAPPAAPEVDVVQPSCSEPTGTITVDVQNGLTYSIDGETYQANGVFTNLSPGTYDVVAQDEFGQLSDLTTIVLAEPVAEDIVLIDNGVVDLCIDDSAFNLFDLIADNEDVGNWIDTDNTGTLDNGFVTPGSLELGTYTFELQIDGNCTQSTFVTVMINDDCVVLDCSVEDVRDSISKAVTPNGDNINDFFTIDTDIACGFTYDLKIFNRWGAKVFDAKNYQNNWDGYSDSSFTSSNQLPSGTYFYVLEIREGNFEPIQGYIYLGTK
ncbi:gliding motility-associated-like protein [Gramella sp. Hel_I_59]|uniref:Ig-like domain-containing protein n=1 Tax=Gramella sp. Hel_I_59 TaxID=1249978 RepID=UPI0011543512|nr:HYR domain-containing protein [Gramella sp. Hel_I_59]TQI70620.1 gliding motility-associated-like protein [Gramella sp. Hel_I_59]